MDRRRFLRDTILAGLGLGLAACRAPQTTAAPSVAQAPTNAPLPRSQEGSPATDAKIGKNRWQAGPVNDIHMAVAKGKSPRELVTAALAAFSGMSAFVRPNDRVVIKPNLAWSRTPEQAACTNPEILQAVIEACKQAGAQEIIVADHTCDAANISFDMSGAKAICAALNVELVDWASPQLYRDVSLPHAQNFQAEQIPADLLDCDVYINLPILKHHGSSIVTIAMKNQMGCVLDRGKYHARGSAGGRNNLHRNIADLAYALRPTLNIVDAVRVLKTNGPKGPGVVEKLDTLIVSPDIVAVDAYAAKLLGHDPLSIPHIAMAAEAGLGEANLNKLLIKEV